MCDDSNISMRKLVDRAMEATDELIRHLESCKIAAPNERAETIFKQCYWNGCSIHTLLQIADDLSQHGDDLPSADDYFEDDDDDDGESVDKG